MIIVNGFQPLAIITKRSILDFAAALDLPLVTDLGQDFDYVPEISIYLSK